MLAGADVPAYPLCDASDGEDYGALLARAASARPGGGARGSGAPALEPDAAALFRHPPVVPPLDAAELSRFLDERSCAAASSLRLASEPKLGAAPRPAYASVRHGALLAWIDAAVPDAGQRKRLRHMVAEGAPRQSKWHDPNRPGQADLYDALERVLAQLRAYVPHSAPFLHRVSRKDVPDYYDVIKRPMDLGTMSRRLREHAYASRADFVADLELMAANCFAYNTDPESPFRRHVTLLRERWQTLVSSIVPDIVLGPASAKSAQDANGSSDESSGSENAEAASDSPAVSRMGSEPDSAAFASGTISASAVDAPAIPSDSSPAPHSSSGEDAFVPLALPARTSAAMGAYVQCPPLRPEVDAFHNTVPDATHVSVRRLPAGPSPVPDETLGVCAAIRTLKARVGGAPEPEGYAGALAAALEAARVEDAALQGRPALAQRLSLLLLSLGYDAAAGAALSVLLEVYEAAVLAVLRHVRPCDEPSSLVCFGDALPGLLSSFYDPASLVRLAVGDVRRAALRYGRAISLAERAASSPRMVSESLSGSSGELAAHRPADGADAFDLGLDDDDPDLQIDAPPGAAVRAEAPDLFAEGLLDASGEGISLDAVLPRGSL